MGLFSFASKRQKSGQVAKDRLQLVIFQDRMNTSPEMLEMLKSDIIKYIKNHNETEQEENFEQEQIQKENPASVETSKKYGNQPDEIILTSTGKAIKKNAAIAKKVLVDCRYRCLCDSSHTTFITPKNAQYMEGHHLIPCTVSNSEEFKGKSKLDREENIVCICPNCHRAIHFGNKETREMLITILYNEQKGKLFSVGLHIDLDELIAKCK